MTLPTKEPVWPAEKNLPYELFGATKNPSGQLRLQGKEDMDGLDLKCKWTFPGWVHRNHHKSWVGTQKPS